MSSHYEESLFNPCRFRGCNVALKRRSSQLQSSKQSFISITSQFPHILSYFHPLSITRKHPIIEFRLRHQPSQRQSHDLGRIKSEAQSSSSRYKHILLAPPCRSNEHPHAITPPFFDQTGNWHQSPFISSKAEVSCVPLGLDFGIQTQLKSLLGPCNDAHEIYEI